MASAIVRTLRDGRLEGGPAPLVVVESNGCHAADGLAVLRLLLRATADAAHAGRAQGRYNTYTGSTESLVYENLLKSLLGHEFLYFYFQLSMAMPVRM